VGIRHDELARRIETINAYRNKIMHGQISGRRLQPHELQNDILTIIEWMNLLGKGAQTAFGYDGLKRDTYQCAKKRGHNPIANYPFDKLDGMLQWIAKIKR
jgi:hypothetical protein